MMGSFRSKIRYCLNDWKQVLTVCNYDRIFTLDSLVCHGFGQVDGEKHRIPLPP